MEVVFAVIAAAAVAGLVIAVAVARQAADAGAVRRQLELLSARLETLEGHENALRSSVELVNQGLARTGAVVEQLQQTTAHVRERLQQASEQLAKLGEAAQTLRETDQKNADVLRRLELLMAGTATKGAAGESIVEALIRQLPAEWRAQDVRIEGKVVEFGLRLPNGLLVPIDSKWPATGLLEELAQAEDPEAAARVRQQLLARVREKMEEVRKYLHPELTAGFAIAAVPDAVFELAAEAQVDGLRMNVVLIGYGSLIPYLLLVVQMALRAGTTVDLEKLAGALHGLREAFAEMEEELDGRFSRALTMLQNSRDELRAKLQRAHTVVTAIEARAEGLPSQGALPGGSDGRTGPSGSPTGT
jgi:DNA recombination protein RmuC